MRFNPLFLKKTIILSSFFAIFCISSLNAFANTEGVDSAKHAAEHTEQVAEGQENAHGKESEFNATETIMEHISDSHDWHLWGEKSVSLPVILKTDAGLVNFSSKEFHHDNKGTHVVEAKGQRFVLFENKIYYASETA